MPGNYFQPAVKLCVGHIIVIHYLLSILYGKGMTHIVVIHSDKIS